MRRYLARRSPAEWAVRVALAAVAAVLGYYGITFSAAQAARKTDPVLAYRLAPYDGRNTAAYAASIVRNNPTLEDGRRAGDLARRALRQDPTAVAALSTLGLIADLRGDRADARRMFASAQALSRRSPSTQLWLIEDAVTRGSVREALRQYDITLRVFPSLEGMLYPVLASASDDPEIRHELVRTLAGKPMWGVNFITFMAGSDSDPQVTAALFVDLHRAGVAVPQAAVAGAVNALIAAGHFDAAWSYYAATHPGADRRRSRDPRFLAQAEAPSQLDWIALNDGGLTTSIQGGLFDFSVPASVGGPLLQQIQLLPPGTYRLIGHSIGLDLPAGASPYWMLSCRGGREIGRIEMPNSSVAKGTFTGTFSVPADCPSQLLLLNARPTDAISGIFGQIDRAELVPVS
ncbi:hypothetical protein [Sphingomonas sp. dw_22]|uniref:tetratricopeptide repeat protein n=1 Tax=Sphingomonas sp. dw_22 TaxID=2721175 RepID=UPI001BD53D9E|nr:hypothetical protein [Sphingomonas sp. dw_22]